MGSVSNIVRRFLAVMWVTILFTAQIDSMAATNGGGLTTVFDSKLKRADRHYNNYEYKPAIKLYLKLAEKNKAGDMVKLKLAESYLKVNNPGHAEKWFAEVIHSLEITLEHQILYAQTLLRTGKYEESRQFIERYHLAEKDSRGEAILATLQRLDKFYGDSMHYEVYPLEINESEFVDFSPVIYKDGIVFVSSRHESGRKFKKDDTPFLDLYYTSNHDFKSAKPFSPKLNSEYHEGPAAFYDDFNSIIFTRSNYLEGQLGETSDGVNNLQLYTAHWNENIEDWDHIEALSFNISDYSFGHPSISIDGTRLYFISDMPGGYGGTDIYISEKLDGGWGKPVNLGEVINTAGNEMYPQIGQENLYFASNGHGGMGGLDLYSSNLKGTIQIKNMGYPVNTPADDFGIVFVPKSQQAYISSDRNGTDNIYSVKIKASNLDEILANNTINSKSGDVDNLTPVLINTGNSLRLEEIEFDHLVTINTKLVDAENSQGLQNAHLKLLINGIEKENLQSDENGQISIRVPEDQQYELLATKEGFEPKRISIPRETLGEEEDILITMRSQDADALKSNEPYLSTSPLANTEEVDNVVKNGNFEPVELDPLVVSDQRMEDSGLAMVEHEEINGVNLPEVPVYEGETQTTLTGNSDVDNFEPDPLAVADQHLEDSGLTMAEHGEINGVSLPEVLVYEGETQPMLTENSDVDNFELDPMTVNDQTGKIDPFLTIEHETSALQDQSNLIDAMVFEANSQSQLSDAHIKIYIDSPNRFVTYELRDGVLTFEAVPGENYLLIASHPKYQDAFIDITGEELLSKDRDNIKFELINNNELVSSYVGSKEALKFKTTIKDQLTGKAVNDAQIKFFVDGKSINSYKSKPNGKAIFKTIPGKDYMALVTREGYQDLVYHIPVTSEDQEIELALLPAIDEEAEIDHQLLANKGIKLVSNPGFNPENMNFKIYENGQLRAETRDLNAVDLDPGQDYQIIASQEGYKDQLLTIDAVDKGHENEILLPLNMQKELISESAASQIQDDQEREKVTMQAQVFDALRQTPLTEARIKIFKNQELQEDTYTWNNGIISFDALTGEQYTLLVTKDGFDDEIVALGIIDSPSTVTVNLVPDNSPAKVLQPAVNLPESKNKQDIDPYKLNSEEELLYVDLSSDEKAIINQLVTHGRKYDNFDDNTELAIYYYNLPAEYQKMVDGMIDNYSDMPEVTDVPKEPNQWQEDKDYQHLSRKLDFIENVKSSNHYDNGETFNINNIFYDFDKSDIREDAAIELDKVVALMHTNKAVKLGLISHTDSRGSSVYNQKLSERRAQAVVDYLVDNGIAMDRLVDHAVGEMQPANSCGDSIHCSEQDHQLNRRTEFKIIF